MNEEEKTVEEKKEEERKQLIQDYQIVFDDIRGKRVLADLTRLSGYDLSIVPTGNDGHIDVYDVLRNEGKRAVVIHILRKIRTDLGKPKPKEAISEL